MILKRNKFSIFANKLKSINTMKKLLIQNKLDTNQDELSELLGKWYNYNTTIIHLKKNTTTKKDSTQTNHLRIIQVTMNLQRITIQKNKCDIPGETLV